MQDPDLPLVFAEEIATREGEIIGLFLTEEIPPGLPAAETLDLIHGQGGLTLDPPSLLHLPGEGALRRRHGTRSWTAST